MMKNSRIKIAAVAVVMCLATLVAPLTAFAVEIPAGCVGKLAVIGDSVSYGAGLKDRAGKCYGAVAASSLGLGEGGYINSAADSVTSAELASALASGDLQVADADLAVVSVGTEEILSVIREAFTSSDVTSYGKLAELAKNGDFIRKLNAEVDYQALLNNAAKYAMNVENIISELRRQSPNIRIVFLSLYDPLRGISDLAPLSNIYASTLGLMNRELEGVAHSNGCYLLKLDEAFADRAAELTNITSLAVTPNEAGHELIAELLCELVETLPEYSSDTEEDTDISTPDESEKPDEEKPSDSDKDPLDVTFREEKSGMIFYIIGAVVIGALGIVVGAVAEAKREKNKK